MSFEQWMKRAVYVVQCRTAKKAGDIGIYAWQLRAVPGHRNAFVQWSRDTLANVLKEERRRVREDKKFYLSLAKGSL